MSLFVPHLSFFWCFVIVAFPGYHHLYFTVVNTTNSFGAKFQTTFVVCFFDFNKLTLEKTFICKVDKQNVKQRRPR